MENIVPANFSDNEDIRSYDLKGSEVNRFKCQIDKKTTLPDINFMIERNGDPILLSVA